MRQYGSKRMVPRAPKKIGADSRRLYDGGPIRRMLPKIVAQETQGVQGGRKAFSVSIIQHSTFNIQLPSFNIHHCIIHRRAPSSLPARSGARVVFLHFPEILFRIHADRIEFRLNNLYGDTVLKKA